MFSKSERLDRGLFEKVRKNGITVTHHLFSLFIGNSPDTVNHYSTVVSSKVAKTAVQRNRIRRISYASFEKIVKKQAPKSYILYAKTPILKANLDAICEALKSSISYYEHRYGQR